MMFKVEDINLMFMTKLILSFEHEYLGRKIAEVLGFNVLSVDMKLYFKQLLTSQLDNLLS